MIKRRSELNQFPSWNFKSACVKYNTRQVIHSLYVCVYLCAVISSYTLVFVVSLLSKQESCFGNTQILPSMHIWTFLMHDFASVSVLIPAASFQLVASVEMVYSVQADTFKEYLVFWYDSCTVTHSGSLVAMQWKLLENWSVSRRTVISYRRWLYTVCLCCITQAKYLC